MKVKKFIFIRDIISSDEWHSEVDCFSDEDQLTYLESLWNEYRSDYVKHGYNALQFFEEYLQIKYLQKD